MARQLKSWWNSLSKYKGVIFLFIIVSSLVWYLEARVACGAHEILGVGIVRHWLSQSTDVGIEILVVFFITLLISKYRDKNYWLLYFTFALIYIAEYLITFLPLVAFCG